MSPVSVFVFQRMSAEFRRWMAFYGKQHSSYQLERGDFLCEDMKEKINAATLVFVLQSFTAMRLSVFIRRRTWRRFVWTVKSSTNAELEAGNKSIKYIKRHFDFRAYLFRI